MPHLPKLPAKHFQSLLTRWPVDSLRPDCQLQNVLAKRLGTGKLAPTVPKTFKSQENADLVQVNAMYVLVEGRFGHVVCYIPCCFRFHYPGGFGAGLEGKGKML
jgi:hypothetical protein